MMGESPSMKDGRDGPSMITVCAWCDRCLETRDVEVTHGICAACTARQHWRESPVLVVAPHRKSMIGVLRHLLQGSPEVTIVLDRRQNQRRRRALAPPIERRAGADRRRRPDLQLI